MNFLSRFLLISVCMVSMAQAQVVKSEIYNQPAAGGNSVLLNLSSSSASFDIKFNGTKAASSSQKNSSLRLIYLYGLNESMAVGASIDTGTNQSTTSPVIGAESENKSTGLGDLGSTFVAVSNLGQFNLRYGSSFGISPGNRKSSSATQNGNRYSGGLSLNPYVALEMGDTDFHYGIGSTYNYFLTRKTDSSATPTTTTESTGGAILTLNPYVEAIVGPGLLGGQFLYGSVASTTSTTNDLSSKQDGYTLMGLSAFYNYGISPEFELIGNLNYLSSNIPASGTLDKIEIPMTTLSVAGRFSF